jgi:predicted  nucleic acid-binding Zn-ribbon protein
MKLYNIIIKDKITFVVNIKTKNMEPTNNNTNNNSKNWIFGAIIAALAGVTIYMYMAKNKAENANHATGEQLATTATAKDAMQTDYNAALGRLDELTSKNKGMEDAINAKDGEVADLKKQIDEILQNKNATQADLNKAKGLIASLNTKVQSFEKQIAQLKESNTNLATEKEQLSVEKQNEMNQKNEVTKQRDEIAEEKKGLEKKVEVAKVLHASNITLLPIKKRLLTGKEAETAKAKRAELIRITFDLDDNRISESGEKELYIVVYAPNGDAYTSGKFKMENGTEKNYTVSKTIPYVQGQTSKNIALDWKPIDAKFEKGDYQLEIYHMGYKIGGNSVSLK